MKKIKPHFYLLSALLLLISLGTACSEKQDSQENHPEALQVNTENPDVPPVPKVEWANILWDETKKDFGQIEQNNPAKFRFTFKNVGKVDLKLENVKPSCSCTASEYTREAIPPGGSGFVEAEFNAKSPGQFTKTISVVTNTEMRTSVLTLTGEVLATE